MKHHSVIFWVSNIEMIHNLRKKMINIDLLQLKLSFPTSHKI